MSKIVLNYPLFDGKRVIENAVVTIENGRIVSIEESDRCTDNDLLLMPGLIDAHTHITSDWQVDVMLKNGITAACDVSAPYSLVENSRQFNIISSAGMTMGTLNGKGYVDDAVENGARYIKVLIFEPNLMPKAVLKSICQTAHKYALKVAIHATSVKAEKMAVDCGADILLHVPMKEELPEGLAKEIAERGIAVAPTLVMMEAFAVSGRNGYVPEHYLNAENAVRTLHRCGVTILAATDANNGSFAPAVEYGSSMHREAELLNKAGLTPVEILTGATSSISETFGIEGIGSVKVGSRADMVLIDGRPDRDITAIRKLKQLWINGEHLL